MIEKRFIGLFQGDMLVSVKDTQTNDRVNIIQIIAIANELNDENEKLKSELAEIKRQEQEVIEYLQAYHKGDVKELKE